MFFSTAIVPKKSSIKGAFSDKHGLRFRQTWSIPTMYPNFGNIGHVSRFWIHCYFWPISRQGFSGTFKGKFRWKYDVFLRFPERNAQRILTKLGTLTPSWSKTPMPKRVQPGWWWFANFMDAIDLLDTPDWPMDFLRLLNFWVCIV